MREGGGQCLVSSLLSRLLRSALSCLSLLITSNLGRDDETLSLDNLDYFELFGGLFFCVGRVCVADGGEI